MNFTRMCVVIYCIYEFLLNQILKKGCQMFNMGDKQRRREIKPDELELEFKKLKGRDENSMLQEAVITEK